MAGYGYDLSNDAILRTFNDT